MNKLVLMFLCFPLFSFGQFTLIPDMAFEQVLVNLGIDNAIDGGVANSSVSAIDTLIVSNAYIESLVGISAFQSLTYLDCSSNSIDTLDLTYNYLTYLDCSDNLLTDIDVSNHLNLRTFKCSHNNLGQVDITVNTSLLYFECFENQLTTLDISDNIFLTELRCNANQLTNLDVAGIDMYVLVCDNNQLTKIDNLSDNISLKHLSCSGNNMYSLLLTAHPQLNWLSCSSNNLFQLDISNQPNLNYLFTWGNSSLNCINVADVSVADATWSVWNGQSGNIDGHHYFSTNCILSSVLDMESSKELISIVNLKGQKTKVFKNEPLLYMYNDGSVEQKIIFE